MSACRKLTHASGWIASTVATSRAVSGPLASTSNNPTLQAVRNHCAVMKPVASSVKRFRASIGFVDVEGAGTEADALTG